MDKLTHEDIPIDFDPRWLKILEKIKTQFGKKPDLETILFLIGINELGSPQEKFTKEQKQDLMHVAVCKLLSLNGYYTLAGWDDDNWPLYEPTIKLPEMSPAEQEELIKKNIITYFE